MTSFLHAGTFGDTIYSLNVVKILGGGEFFIELDGMNDLALRAWGVRDAGFHNGRYTTKDIDFLMPLLEKQSYIKKAQIWNGEKVDYDLRDQYKMWVKRNGKLENWLGNQTECYAELCGLNMHEHRKALLIDPWLDPLDPIKIPGKTVIINRTFRHIRRDTFKMPLTNDQWFTWLHEDSLEDMALFVGSEVEHEDFCKMFDCKVEYKPVSDMLELARLIQGCEQFMGNQSLALSLAVGLGKTFWCEIRVDYENLKTEHGYGDVWFPRSNGHYF